MRMCREKTGAMGLPFFLSVGTAVSRVPLSLRIGTALGSPWYFGIRQSSLHYDPGENKTGRFLFESGSQSQLRVQ